MAGQEDWEQLTFQGVNLWGHVPCGGVVMQSGTSAHEGLCPALQESPPEPDLS